MIKVSISFQQFPFKMTRCLWLLCIISVHMWTAVQSELDGTSFSDGMDFDPFYQPVGTTRTFDCGAKSPNMDISWYRGNQSTDPIPTSGNAARMSQSLSRQLSSISMENLQLNDSDTYVCFLTTGNGTFFQRTWRRVIVYSPVHEEPQAGYNAFLADNVTLTCPANGTGQLNITWMYPSDQRYEVRNGHLLIHYVRREESGNYTCMVKQTVEGKEVKQISITVPLIITYNPNVTLHASFNGSQNLDCDIFDSRTTPNIAYFWEKLEDNTGLRVRMPDVSQGRLVLNVTSEFDFGHYVCNASVDDKHFGKHFYLLQGHEPIPIVQTFNPPEHRTTVSGSGRIRAVASVLFGLIIVAVAF